MSDSQPPTQERPHDPPPQYQAATSLLTVRGVEIQSTVVTEYFHRLRIDPSFVPPTLDLNLDAVPMPSYQGLGRQQCINMACSYIPTMARPGAIRLVHPGPGLYSFTIIRRTYLMSTVQIRVSRNPGPDGSQPLFEAHGTDRTSLDPGLLALELVCARNEWAIPTVDDVITKPLEFRLSVAKKISETSRRQRGEND